MDPWQYKSRCPEINLTGLDLQTQQKHIFLYRSGYNYFARDNGLEIAFASLRIGEIVLPRVAWYGYHAGIILHGQIIYSDREKTLSTNKKRIGPYVKVLISDDWNVFRNWCDGKFQYGREGADKNGVEKSIQWNAKDLNNWMKFVDRRDFPGYEKKIQCFRFDPWGEETQFLGMIFKKGKGSFIEHLHQNCGTDKRIDEVFEYYFDFGINLIPINCFYRFCYRDIGPLPSIHKLMKVFFDKGLEISPTTAKYLRSFITGASYDPKYTNMSVTGFREVAFDNRVVPELSNTPYSCISISLCPHKDKRRTIPVFSKRESLRRWNYQIFNKDNNSLTGSYYEPVISYLTYRTCHSVFRKKDTAWLLGRSKEYYDGLSGSIRWDTVYDMWNLTQKSSLIFHHPVAWDILFKIASPGFDCNHPKLLLPMLPCDHTKLHSVCGAIAGINQMDFIIDQEWSPKDVIRLYWAEMIKHIITEEQKLSGRNMTPLIKHLWDNGFVPAGIKIQKYRREGDEYAKIFSCS